MKYKIFSFVLFMIIAVFASSNAFARVVLDDIEYNITSWPVCVGDWCEFYTLAAANPMVENLVVVGHVDGVEVYRETFPTVSMDTNPRISFRWQALTAGSHEIDIVADPAGTFGAPYVRKLTMPVKPVDLTFKPMKLLSGTPLMDHRLTIAGYVVNKNDIAISDSFYVDFKHKPTNLGHIEVRGIGPKETKTVKLDVVCSGDYFDIDMTIDSTNVIAEANETNNLARLFLRCTKSVPGITLAK